MVDNHMMIIAVRVIQKIDGQLRFLNRGTFSLKERFWCLHEFK